VKSLAGDQALWQALPQTQVLINLLPLTPHTLGLLNAPLFATLPRGAGVVNLARGRHLVDDDLLAALDSGQVGHAVLDVFHAEPLPTGHAFWSHRRHAAAACGCADRCAQRRRGGGGQPARAARRRAVAPSGRAHARLAACSASTGAPAQAAGTSGRSGSIISTGAARHPRGRSASPGDADP
jgi:hypothetical protein